MAKEETDTEEIVIGKNSTEALAFLASLDPANFPPTTVSETFTEIKIPGYVLEFFLDFIRKLYFKAKVDTGDEAPLASGLPLTPVEEKLNTLLKGLEERDDEYFTKVPFPLTTIRAEKDPISVAVEMPLPELLQELFLDVAAQFVDQISSIPSPDASVESGSTKLESSSSSATTVSLSSEVSIGSADTVTRTSVPLRYRRPNLERLRKIIYTCITKPEPEIKLGPSSSSASQPSIIELMAVASAEESSTSRSSKSTPTGESTSSQATESRVSSRTSSRTSQPSSQSSLPVAAAEKVKSVEATTEEEQSVPSLVTVKTLTSVPSIADMTPPELNKYAAEIYMTRFYDLTQQTGSPLMTFIETLLEEPKLDSRAEIISGLKVVKETAETETIDIFKFSNEQVKMLRSRAQKNFNFMSRAKNKRDIKCLQRIKHTGKAVALRAI